MRHQVQALKNDADLLVISGESAPPDFPCSVVRIPAVGYRIDGKDHLCGDEIADHIDQEIQRHFGGPCDVLHIHNPILNKNWGFIDIINALQKGGFNLFLQIHDFAEDGRPANYYRDQPYPENCHYGVINLRDYSLLREAGLVAEGLHYLPNAVIPIERSAHASTTSFVLYPVRAIRRKNIGETLLLALFFPVNEAIYITQPPNSPLDFPSYQDWRSYVDAHHLPIRFEMGVHHSFQQLMASANVVLTTSVAEGFGFTYLEPWTAGKYLTGRLLPEICQDFSKRGISLDHLYASIQVPMAWIGIDRIIDRFSRCMGSNRSAYGDCWPASWEDKFIEALSRMKSIDFGMLSEHFQRVVLDKVQDDRSCLLELLERNPFLETMLTSRRESQLIQRNGERILSVYHPDRYRDRLLKIYHAILSQPIQHRINKKALLRGFLTPGNFSLLKWGTYEE